MELLTEGHDIVPRLADADVSTGRLGKHSHPLQQWDPAGVVADHAVDVEGEEAPVLEVHPPRRHGQHLVAELASLSAPRRPHEPLGPQQRDLELLRGTELAPRLDDRLPEKRLLSQS